MDHGPPACLDPDDDDVVVVAGGTGRATATARHCHRTPLLRQQRLTRALGPAGDARRAVRRMLRRDDIRTQDGRLRQTARQECPVQPRLRPTGAPVRVVQL